MESLSPTHGRFSPLRKISRFIPPAAKRPATAIPSLLVSFTLIYLLWTTTHSVSPLYDTTNDVSIPSYLKDHHHGVEKNIPVMDSLEEAFASSKLPPALSQDPSLAKLSERLVQFLDRPVLSHDEAKESMRVHCPLEISDRLVNPDQYNGDSEFWKNQVTKEVIIEKRSALVNWLGDKVEQGEKVVWEEGLGKGKGIIMTAGNKVCTDFPL